MMVKCSRKDTFKIYLAMNAVGLIHAKGSQLVIVVSNYLTAQNKAVLVADGYYPR